LSYIRPSLIMECITSITADIFDWTSRLLCAIISVSNLKERTLISCHSFLPNPKNVLHTQYKYTELIFFNQIWKYIPCKSCMDFKNVLCRYILVKKNCHHTSFLSSNNILWNIFIHICWDCISSKLILNILLIKVIFRHAFSAFIWISFEIRQIFVPFSLWRKNTLLIQHYSSYFRDARIFNFR
jgi:hypothetical protein